MDVSKVQLIFPDVEISNMVRPSGQIDMLIGADCCELLSQVVRTEGKLQLLQNCFGYCLRGGHPLINTNNNNEIGHLTAVVSKAAVNLEHSSLFIEQSKDLKGSLDKFFRLDVVGTECNPRCTLCLCKECPPDGSYTLGNERELNLIERGLSYDEGKKWVAAYPWIKDPFKLPNNVKTALARLKSTEKRLHRFGDEYSKEHQRAIEDMINRGVAVKLTKQDIVKYDGPSHYIPHYEILKPE